jgi:hypothetical protein
VGNEGHEIAGDLLGSEFVGQVRKYRIMVDDLPPKQFLMITLWNPRVGPKF